VPGEIIAVTVTFNPDLSMLRKQIENLTASEIEIVIVDNGSTSVAGLLTLADEYKSVLKLTMLETNKGIAAAQNIGIGFALEHHYTYVLLMDQDSLPAEGMVSQLYQAAQHYSKLAAVGPQFIDQNGHVHSRFIRTKGLFIDKQLKADEFGCVEVDHLIASGSLIPLKVFDRIGKMEEGLFIDYVDVEWALRAKSKGLHSYGVLAAKMVHSLGDKRVHLLGRSVAIHQPLRHYYQSRNAILLYQRNYIPWSWKVVDAYKLLAKLIVFILASSQKKIELKMIAKGLFDGIRNVKGKYS